MEVYFDNAATTRILPEVKDIMLETMDTAYGNPSSKHHKGVEAENYVRQARSAISRQLKCEASEICFTSGGTESNNLALFGLTQANQRSGRHIISTGIEHASVYQPLFRLQEMGFEVTFLQVDGQGRVDLDALREALREDTILVSAMAVNNEIGSVQPISQMAEVIKSRSRDILFHVDAVQAFGKQVLYPSRLGIDAMSMSGHKIHGPKGSGALYIAKGVKIRPLLSGGGQERDLRSGTENTTAIAGMGKACELAYRNLAENVEKMMAVKRTLLEGALKLDGVEDHSGEAPHIASLSFQGIKSEVLLHALEDRGICVSSGSACSSNHPAVSGVLKAIGLRQELLDSTLRFSFSELNTVEEAQYTVEQLRELLPFLRRFTRK